MSPMASRPFWGRGGDSQCPWGAARPPTQPLSLPVRRLERRVSEINGSAATAAGIPLGFPRDLKPGNVVAKVCASDFGERITKGRDRAPPAVAPGGAGAEGELGRSPADGATSANTSSGVSQEPGPVPPPPGENPPGAPAATMAPGARDLPRRSRKSGVGQGKPVVPAAGHAPRKWGIFQAWFPASRRNPIALHCWMTPAAPLGAGQGAEGVSVPGAHPKWGHPNPGSPQSPW